MKTYRSICLLLIAAVGATASFAQTNPGTKADTPPPSTPQGTDTDNILKIVTQTQNDVKALEAAVASLAANQKDQAAQTSVLLKDVSRRVYATCVLTQRQMNMIVPGGWSENALCSYHGLTAGGDAVTQDLFGQNPTNIDTAFGGP
jgi:hypothetical protein